MKKTLAIVMFALFITGCATPADLRRYGPTLELISDKPAKQVAICISDTWENTTSFGSGGPMPVTLNLKQDGYSVIATNHGLTSTWPELIADVHDDGRGSTTRYYKAGTPWFGAFDDVVRNCQ